ncbi:DNApol-eta isoform X1 [Papilio machaon]|uniref:DNApol-eta isoform X1 n=2 Tax=Papilio machaon TaxID=76193 RepID=UPI001E664DA3|nr:DNApol-eta isoform X1 [Papilio machaon]
MNQENRIVTLIDMDCFYCQVEEKLNPELKGKPVAVVQYNPWKGGGIIAVNYVARAMGVSRHLRGDEAKEKCPDIQLPNVPCIRGKADLTKYREAGKEVARVLQRFTPLFERASIDEAYLDITIPVQQRLQTLNVNTLKTAMVPNTFVLGYDSIEDFIAEVQGCSSDNIDFDYEQAKQLLVGATIVSEIRAAVFNETGYECSAGIAHNKIMAKLVCGMNKPNKQTVLPKHCIDILFESLPVKKVKSLGGKFGYNVCGTLKISKMGELQKFSKAELQNKFDEKNGLWLYNIARGIDLEPVQTRFNPKSIGCCKQFRGKTALTDLQSIKKWFKELSDEIEERLEQDALETNRTPRQMVVSFSQQVNGRDISSSRSYNFLADDDLCAELFCQKALELLLDSTEGVKPKEGEPNRQLKAPIKFLGISVGKFEDHSDSKKIKKIKDYFSFASSVKEVPNENKETRSTKIFEEKIVKKNEGKEQIFQKFFKSNLVSTSNTSIDTKDNIIIEQKDENVLQSSLDKQESFFAKFLNSEQKNNTSGKASRIDEIRTPSPNCNINCGEASNDTDYSGSTIDMEINKSISLFEDDPLDIDRVSSMRQLLNKSNLTEEIYNDTNPSSDNKVENSEPKNLESFKCPDCGKIIDINVIDTHADYHLALKLREEERELRRKEVVEKNKDKKIVSDKNYAKATPVRETSKIKPIPDQAKKIEGVSIASYFMKIDDNSPTETCAECGKKLPMDKFGEHLDFHAAQKLSRELNNKIVKSNNVENSAKRKRNSGSPVKKPKVQCKPIDLFFR